MWESNLFAIGHFGLGYLLGKFSAKVTNVEIDLALLFTVSILPDLDMLFFSFVQHRGPSHSIFFLLLPSIPFFVIYRKKAVPYIVALFSHTLIGDIFTGGTQLLWPFSSTWYNLSNFSVRSDFSVGMELSIFIVCTILMLFAKDFQKLFLNKTRLVYLLLSLGAVIGPLFMNFNFYFQLPTLLIIPSLFYVAVFSVVIFRLKFSNSKTQYPKDRC